MHTLEILLLVLAIFGGVDLADRGARVLVTLFPRLLTVQSKIWRLLADSFTIPVFRRKAIATRVEEVLNQTAFHLQQFLPKGWVKRAKVRWVRNSQTAQLMDGTIVLRVRPGPNPDHNLMQTLWIYFHSALFPNTRDILPDDLVSGVALAITRAGLEESHPYMLREFDDAFLGLIAGGKQAILNHFGDSVRLNDYGLLMGPFLREVDQAATDSRFTPERAKLPEIVDAIIAHMLSFQPFLRRNKPEDDWSHQGPCSSYGFLLVSKPPEIRPGIEAYVKRAQDKLRKGINRLYVIGRYEEREFLWRVTNALLSIRELKGVELFPLFRDYRGEPSGVGALLANDQLLAKLNLSQRPIESFPSQFAVSHLDDVLEPVAESGALDDVAQRDLAKITEDLIVQLSDYEGAWISLAEFGNELRKQIPGFSPQKYGGRNLISVLRRLSSLEIDERGAGPAKSVFVRMRGANTLQHSAADDHKIAYARIEAIVRKHAHEDGWIFLGQLGHLLRIEFAEFEYAKFGASSFHEFMSGIPALEIEERGEGHSKTYVRVKQPVPV